MRIAIIGAGAQEEFYDESLYNEVWCLNHIFPEWLTGCSRHFNIHPFERLKEYGYDLLADRDEAQANPQIPFYVADPWPEGWLPDQRIFPRDELSKLPRGDYHCGSFDWLVAFVVYLNLCAAELTDYEMNRHRITEISLHGISLALEHGEPISARACLEYWCGYAESCGIKVTTAEDCDLFFFFHLVKSRLVYGYDDTPVFEDRTRKGAPYHLSQTRTAAMRRRSA